MSSSGISTRFVINTFLLLLMLSFNLYKLNLVESIQAKREACYQAIPSSSSPQFQSAGKEACNRNNIYPMFPWQLHPQAVKIDMDTLWWHTLTAITLLILSYLHTLNPPVKILDALFYCVHVAFTAILVPNLNQLGDFSPQIASAILITLLGALQLALLFGLRDCHFWTLSIVPLAEVGLWVVTKVL
jgi:hypothetical protein